MSFLDKKKSCHTFLEYFFNSSLVFGGCCGFKMSKNMIFGLYKKLTIGGVTGSRRKKKIKNKKTTQLDVSDEFANSEGSRRLDLVCAGALHKKKSFSQFLKFFDHFSLFFFICIVGMSQFLQKFGKLTIFRIFRI